MTAIAELFDETVLMLPCYQRIDHEGEISLQGHKMRIVPLSPRRGAGLYSKLSFLPWLLLNSVTIMREVRRADGVHAPIPGDVGTVGMLLAWLFRMPLFVRHCGNWLRPVTRAEKLWRWFMEAFAGGRNVMLATGGSAGPPSRKNPNVHWIFSTSLTRSELQIYAKVRTYPSDGRLRLIIVARQERAKGAATVIQSLPLLEKTFPQVSLDIVGEGGAIPEFKRLAAKACIAGRVRFSGKLNHDQVMQRLQGAHLFAFPTTSSDGFPKVVLEALAVGLPVVATKVSVLPQLLGNGCGMLLSEATPEALARSIEKALSDPAVFEAMSRQAIATARQYSLEAWRDIIGGYLTSTWGPLKTEDYRIQDAERRNQESVASGP
jgi:hypothetical protein